MTFALVSSTGSISSETDAATQWLLGLRYLTQNETTIIAEYYRNNGGYTSQELQNFFTAVDFATDTSNTTLLNTLATVLSGAQSRPGVSVSASEQQGTV